MWVFQIKLKNHCFEPIKLQKFKFKALNNNAGALFVWNSTDAKEVLPFEEDRK